jgi:osmoprotectant transport system substrate-binding protein
MNIKNKRRTIAVILAAVLAGVFAGCGKSKEPIKIASKPMTEQYILTEILGS